MDYHISDMSNISGSTQRDEVKSRLVGYFPFHRYHWFGIKLLPVDGLYVVVVTKRGYLVFTRRIYSFGSGSAHEFGVG